MTRESRWALVFLAVGALGGCGRATADDVTEVRRAAVLGSSSFLATASLGRPTDFAPFSDTLENGLPQNVLGGIGSGLSWAGGTTFLAVPDRGPNATSYPNGAAIDNTASYIARFETLDLALSATPSGSLPYTLTPTLQATTLLFSDTALAYGNTAGLPSGVPVDNSPGKFYFTGRSDNFGVGLSTNPGFGRIDPECIRVSRDGNTVFIADEYGPYVYQFDRATGRRIHVYQLPDHFAISNLSPVGAVEIATNTSGRVTNKGIEGLAITPDGTMLVALVQSPLIQDGGDGGRANRIVTIDVASGDTHEYVYDNRIGSKNYNSSEILALNDHQFLIDTRDGKGLGDGSVAVVKQLWAVDISGAQDVSALHGEATLLPFAVPKKLFLDIVGVLNANGIASTQIPAKIEGVAFGPDLGTMHTLYVGNDNDFVPDVAGPSRWYVFGFTDADLAALGLSYTPQQITDRGPDLALTKTAGAATAVTGTEVSYTLTVTNNGLVPASSVLVADLLPAGLTLTGCTSVGTCGVAASGPTVAFDSLAGATTQTATITAKVDCAVADGGVIVNNASASSALADPTPNDNAASATIIVVNPAPTISGVSVSEPVLWPPNKSMHTVTVSYGVADNCAGTVCSLSVASNEGSSVDWQVVDAHTVQLRADRDGNGPGRVYSIPISCKDSGGAVSVQTATVVVPHNQ
jgi:uncharacterized repeat protein (TIGR01451 family)